MTAPRPSAQLQKDRINAIRLVDRLEATSHRLDPKGKRPDPNGEDAGAALDYWQLKALDTTVLHAQKVVAGLPRSVLAPMQIADMRGRLVAVEQRVKAALASTAPPPLADTTATLDFKFSLPPAPPPPNIAVVRPRASSTITDPDLSLDVAEPLGDVEPFGAPARTRDDLLAGSKPAPSLAPDVPASTNSIDSLLSSHRTTQDALTSELADMAHQLRSNALHFNELLEKDKGVMDEAKDKLEGNLGRIQKEGGRLGVYSKRARGTTCYTILAITMVAVAWTVMFIVIRIT